MSRFFWVLLLVDLAAIVFFRFPISYAWLYWACVILIVPLTFLVYLSGFHVGAYSVARIAAGSSCTLLPLAVLPVSDERANSSFGRLAVIGQKLCFLAKDRGRVHVLYEVAVEEILSFQTGRVNNHRSGVRFLTATGESEFSVLNNRNLEQKIRKALHWSSDYSRL